MLLSCQNLSKEYVTGPVLSGISFHLDRGEKMAIVGINGAGKTTLLRILLGEVTPEEGSVTWQKDVRTGYLAQNDTVDSSLTLYEEVLSGCSRLVEFESRLSEMERMMEQASGDALTELMERYEQTRHRFDLMGGYSFRSEIIGVLKGLGFAEEDFSRSVTTLSGGQKTRLALGKLLLGKPDLLILDEPTNHLDMNSTAWLEEYLRSYSGAVLLVSHDRYFLDRLARKILELENTKGRVYEGNYSDYAKKKKQLREAALKAWMNQQSEILHQEEVIEKLRSFNREKSIKRAESREKVLEKTVLLERPEEVDSRMHLSLSPDRISGNDVLSIEGLSKAFGDRTLFTDLSMDLKRGEHVALIGDNGTGKTTLLKILNGLETQDAGSIRLGTNVEIGYYDQEHQLLHPEKTIFEELSDEYPGMTVTRIRNTLASFLFTGDDVFKKISSLSGGERGRVALARLMLTGCNFLILDEPTNHLDIDSKEILEDALLSYEGTVLCVSHDRYFINRIATRILDLRGSSLTSYLGNYDDYLEKRAQQSASSSAAVITAGPGQQKVPVSGSPDTPDASASGSADWKAQKEEQARRRKLENELKKCEERIEELEGLLSRTDEELSDPENASNAEKLRSLTEKREELELSLEREMENWEKLSEEVQS
ncbi:MAG: ABC-F family ATP-binding cassette domain-containing protein [Lachnospiraceae bacterium]|nr:ABC-F family ATP-binding cassette domain-containing protein [Lachnospiraceae bacterium]